MSWDLTKLKNCAIHGRHTGAECPLCDGTKVIPMPTPEPHDADPFASERETWWKGPESELHELLLVWLEHHEVEVVHSRLDVKSTIESGWPDMTCIYTAADGITRACLIELKNRTGKLRKDQVEVIDRHRRRNLPVLVTGNFTDACNFVKNSLQIPIPK